MSIALSPLPHTWLIDIDGTVLEHNSHLQGEDRLLPGVKEFWGAIPAGDVIILLSARTEEHRVATLGYLARQGLRFDHALFNLPVGERILINDRKPSGLETAFALNIQRNGGMNPATFHIDRGR